MHAILPEQNFPLISSRLGTAIESMLEAADMIRDEALAEAATLTADQIMTLLRIIVVSEE
jgi:hypothetical protein